jgi:hypothetical protein
VWAPTTVIGSPFDSSPLLGPWQVAQSLSVAMIPGAGPWPAPVAKLTLSWHVPQAPEYGTFL